MTSPKPVSFPTSSMIPDALWHLSPYPAFLLSDSWQVIGVNTALSAHLRHGHEIPPGSRLMDFAGMTKATTFETWISQFLSREDLTPLDLELPALNAPVIWTEVLAFGDTILVRGVPAGLASAPEPPQEEEQGFMGKMAKAVSHDLRAPVRQLRIFAQRIQDHVPDDATSDLAIDIGFILSSSQVLYDRMESFADFITLESKVPEKQLADLREIAQQASRHIGSDISARQGSIHVGLLPTVMGDPFWIRDIFSELFANAVRHTPRDQAPVIHIEARPAPDGVSIAVTDQGMGFEPKNAPAVFEFFHLVHTEEDFPSRRMGMGLTKARRQAQKMGMDMTAEGHPGEGATIFLHIPSKLIRK